MQKLTKQIRAYLNMSQTEFAKQLNVTFQTVNRWENGRAPVSYTHLDVYKRQALFCRGQLRKDLRDLLIVNPQLATVRRKGEAVAGVFLRVTETL